MVDPALCQKARQFSSSSSELLQQEGPSGSKDRACSPDLSAPSYIPAHVCTTCELKPSKGGQGVRGTQNSSVRRKQGP